MNQQELTSALCVETGCNQEDLLGEIDHWDGWRERESLGTLCYHRDFMMIITMMICKHNKNAFNI